MGIKHLDAIVLRTNDLERCAAFYRAVGLQVKEEKHGDGPAHFACELGGVHFAIYGADTEGTPLSRTAGGATMIGFQVDSVETAFEAAVNSGGTPVVEPDDYPWGRRALVRDPDGRAVEFNCAPGLPVRSVSGS